MKKAFRWLHDHVPIRYWALAHSFLALGLGWGHAIALFPPTSYDGVVDLELVLRMGVLTGVGSIVAVVGLFMTRSVNNRRQHKGLWIELVGTILMGGGPLQYMGLQLAFLYDGAFAQRYALFWLAYALCAAIVVRYAIIIPALIAASREVRIEERRDAARA